MNRLTLKLLRDLIASRWQFLAISLVAALGVAMYQGSMLSYERQKTSYQLSYDRLAFGDVWIALRRAPRSVVTGIARMPGVLAVEGRIAQFVEVEQKGGRRPRVVGRLLTLPTNREVTINRLRLLEGRWLGTQSRREVLLEASFARANRYRPGDRIYPKYLGKQVTFTVAGIVSSPEFIYPVMSAQFSLPMPEVFGAMFVPEEVIGPMLGMAGQINEVVLRTVPGREREIAAAVKQRLNAYGPEEPVLRAEQPSNKLLQSDLEGNKPFLVIMPMLFLGSAALAVGLVLARWVQAQRGIIGFLRASGFPAWRILTHYLGAGLLVGMSGGVLGVVLGYLMGAWFGSAYERVLKTPYTTAEGRPDIALTAFLLSVGACLLGAYGPARQAARILPAEAMRGQVPAQPRRLLHFRMPLLVTIPVRNLLRRPLRTLGTAGGVASAVILMLIAGTFRDSMEGSIAQSLDDFRRYDITVTFVPERSERFVRYISTWPGVLRAEPTLDIPVRAYHAGFQKETVVMGMTPDTRLRQVRGPAGLPVLPRPGTVLVSRALARRLRAEEGSLLRLVYPQNTRERRAVAYRHMGAPVQSIVGMPIYMPMEEARRLFASRLQMPPDAVSGAVLDVHPHYLTQIRDRLYRTDGVGLTLTYAELQRQIDEVTAFAQTFISIMFLLGAAMAFAVVYTVTDIVLWERTRELATLRTLGFGMDHLIRLVSLENLLMALIGGVIAVVPALQIARIMMEAASTEGFSMQLVTYPRSYMMALLGTMAVVFLAQWPGLRRVRRLDLAEAIRLRE
ncbi:MAG: FtsX-like permease family protein [Chloroherpetonaceae bacterium]|nr:FtsX-like permease family protein [Chthonomonadaceae bacterium]MDW8207124.1 FtsX-like permease family protein [Chloroherpetonaceae bacterium]